MIIRELKRRYWLLRYKIRRPDTMNDYIRYLLIKDRKHGGFHAQFRENSIKVERW